MKTSQDEPTSSRAMGIPRRADDDMQRLFDVASQRATLARSSSQFSTTMTRGCRRSPGSLVSRKRWPSGVTS